MKRALTALALCLALSGCTASSAAKGKMDEQGRISGTFTGTGQGKQGEIKVDVMIDRNQIQHIEILSHNEIPGFDTAMVQMSDEILSKNSRTRQKVFWKPCRMRSIRPGSARISWAGATRKTRNRKLHATC